MSTLFLLMSLGINEDYIRLSGMCNLSCIKDIESEVFVYPHRSIELVRPIILLEGSGCGLVADDGLWIAKGEAWEHFHFHEWDLIPKRRYTYSITGRYLLIIPFKKIRVIIGQEKGKKAKAEIKWLVDFSRSTWYQEYENMQSLVGGAMEVGKINIGWKSYIPGESKEIDIHTYLYYHEGFTHRTYAETLYSYPPSTHTISIGTNRFWDTEFDGSWSSSTSGFTLRAKKKILPSLILGESINFSSWGFSHSLGIARLSSPNAIWGLDLRFKGLISYPTVVIGGEKRKGDLELRGGAEIPTSDPEDFILAIGLGYYLWDKLRIDCRLGGDSLMEIMRLGIRWKF
jgi:hypothetical protein